MGLWLTAVLALLAVSDPPGAASPGGETAPVGAAVAPVALLVGSPGSLILEANMIGSVSPTWRNTGTQPLPSVTGVMANFTGPAGPTYTIGDGTGWYGSLAVGQAAACFSSPTSDCYEVFITAAVRPATHWDAFITETITPTSAVKVWRLHVGSTFTDVPRSHSFNRFVEAIVHKDVTGGCTPTTYCPDAHASREQMAVFVLVAKEAAGYVPPPCGAPMFADVPASSPFCRWIEELARRGVVAGCGGGNYCPGASVSRAQMPVFVLRTLDPALNPPACATPLFADVPASSPFCRWIEELVRRHVIIGCGNGNYCPDTPITRLTMSVFIAETFALTLYGL